jgi:hypothetical protein
MAQIASYLLGFRMVKIAVLVAVGALVVFVFYEPVRVEETIGMYTKRAAFALLLGVAIVVSAVMLYKVRCVRPAFYGAIELGIGVYTAGFAAGNLLGVFSHTTLNLFAVAAAIYVFVRGLDNLYRSLSADARWKWNRVFYDQDTDKKL